MNRPTFESGSTVFSLMSLATVMTVVAVIASKPGGPASSIPGIGVVYEATAESKGAMISRVIVGGVLATAGLLAAEQAAPTLTRRFAALVFLTSLFVNGVPLATALTRLASPQPKKAA